MTCYYWSEERYQRQKRVQHIDNGIDSHGEKNLAVYMPYKCASNSNRIHGTTKRMNEHGDFNTSVSEMDRCSMLKESVSM